LTFLAIPHLGGEFEEDFMSPNRLNQRAILRATQPCQVCTTYTFNVSLLSMYRSMRRSVCH